MRHQKAGKKFNRDIHERQALFRNLAEALIIHESIKTTLVKAKVVSRLTAKLITKAKKGGLHQRRQILAILPQKKAAHKLVDELGKRFAKRTSGFTRIVRLGKRRGDDSMMVRLEFVDKAAVKTPRTVAKAKPR